jgi:hypothetical protein
LAVAAVFAPAALAARVHMRVEGKTTTIFGASEPVLDASTALAALDVASVAGEFYYHVASTAYGPYVDQIGRYAAGGPSGWTFKVNGVSAPVGADKVTLHAGDRVLWYWATFGPTGGPPTLVLKRERRAGCYRVLQQDDAGKTSPASGAVLHVDGRSTRRSCVGRHRGLVRATKAGAVRSNTLP